MARRRKCNKVRGYTNGVGYRDSIRKKANNLEVVECCIQFHYMLLELRIHLM